MDWFANIYSYIKNRINDFVNPPPKPHYDPYCQSLTLKKLRCKNKKLYGVSYYYCWVHHKLYPKKAAKMLSNHMCKDVSNMICAKL